MTKRVPVPTMHISECPAISMEPVQSSRIHSIGHDADSNTLAIRFLDGEGGPGSLYHYRNFTAEQYAEFSAAPSFNSHFLKHIKPNVQLFPYTKILETEQPAN